jgi:hypothetical protein
MGKINYTFLFLGVVSVSAVFAGCAKDQTVDQWQADQVKQQLGKIQAVSGIYAGNLISVKNGSTLGPLSIDLEPDTTIEENSDHTGTQQVAAIRGQLAFNGDSSADVAFAQGYYNADSSYFKSTIPITLDAGGTGQLDISGTISGSTLTGQIGAHDYPNLGGTFTLTLGAASSSQGLSTGSSGNPSNQVQVYYGSRQVQSASGTLSKLNTVTESVTMTVDSSYTTPEESFLNLFVPTRYTQVTFGYMNNQIPLLFTNAKIDDRVRGLSGDVTLTDGGDTFIDHMACFQATQSGKSGWNCKVTNSVKGQILSSYFGPSAPGAGQ